MHAVEIAQQMEMRKVMIPPWAGVLSSLGLLLAEPLHDFVRTMLCAAENAEPSRLTREFRLMERRGGRLLEQEGVGRESQVFTWFLDMRYAGQSYELPVQIPSRALSVEGVRVAVRRFHAAHESRYGYKDEGNGVEIVNLRVYCRGRSRQLLPRQTPVKTAWRVKARRDAYVGGEWVRACPVFDRTEAPIGSTGKGPCIMEDYDSTLVLPGGARYVVDRAGSLRIAL